MFRSSSLEVEPGSAEYLRRLCLTENRTELRACYPNDIIQIIHSISRYERRPPVINRSNLERATALYFAKS